MNIIRKDVQKPVELKWEDIKINETYTLAGSPDVVVLCGALIVGDSYNSRTIVKKIINLKDGHILSSNHCGHLRFIHINAAVVL